MKYIFPKSVTRITIFARFQRNGWHMGNLLEDIFMLVMRQINLILKYTNKKSLVLNPLLNIVRGLTLWINSAIATNTIWYELCIS